jgi:carbon monoxide dehydrogenase subunit G
VPTYTATLVTSASVDQAFAYLAQFDNTVRWDPGVVSARALGDGPPARGSRFSLTLRLGGGNEDLAYEITEYDPPRRVVLIADGSRFVSHDEISVAASGAGSEVTYRAELALKGLMKIGAPFAGRALRKAGDAAVAGLARELAQLGE